MNLSNAHLFELINAGAQPSLFALTLARLVAQCIVPAVPIAWLVLWSRAGPIGRLDLLHVVVAVLLALGLAQLIGLAWPSPRPFALHIGHQYMAHVEDPGLPSDHVTLLWSLALATLATTRASWLVFPLLSLGLAVGWARVYLGVHFPIDVFGALPVAAAGAAMALAVRRPLSSSMLAMLSRYDGWERAALHFLHRD